MEKRSKMGEKLEFFKEWNKKYPTVVLYNSAVVKNYIDSLESNEEVSAFLDMYEKAMNYSTYLRVRLGQGKLSEEEITELKEFNLGGILGYSKRVEELHEKYGISKYDAVLLLNKYGSIEDLYVAYKNGKELEEYEIDILKYAINSIVDINESEYSENYKTLARAICGVKDEDFEDIYLYSSENLEIVIQSLTEFEQEIVNERYGLKDGKMKTLEELGKIFHKSKERIRQIEGKIVRKLRNRFRFNKCIINLNETINTLDISEEDKKLLMKAEMTIILSKDKEEIKLAKEILKKHVYDEFVVLNSFETLKERLQQEAEEGTEVEITPDKIYIGDLDLSVRAFNVLNRAGIRTVQDIIDYPNLWKIRNMGKLTLGEIVNKLLMLGIDIENKKIIIEENEATAKEREIFANMDISCLDLSTNANTCLARGGVSKVGDLLRYGQIYGNILKIRGLGVVTFNEIIEVLQKYGYEFTSDGVFVAKDVLPQEFYDLIERFGQDVAEENRDKNNIDTMLIKDLGLSKRPYNSLTIRAGLITVKDLLRFGDIRRIRNLGEKSYQEIIKKLDEIGYVLNEDNFFVAKPEETIVPTEQEPDVKEDSIEVLRTETEELEIAIKEKEEKSKLLDEYIELAKQHAKLKETESKLDEEIRKKEEMLKGFGFKYEKK